MRIVDINRSRAITLALLGISGAMQLDRYETGRVIRRARRVYFKEHRSAGWAIGEGYKQALAFFRCHTSQGASV